MKPEPSAQKLRGGYYTPKPIADFLAEWAIRSPTTEVLDPSCGDGALLESAAEVLIRRGADKSSVGKLVCGAEIDPQEASKAADRLRRLGVPGTSAQLHTGDFFAFCKEQLLEYELFDVVVSEGRLFDAIIGNPPFIRYQSFPEEYRVPAFEVMRRAGLNPNRMTNSWVPFLAASTLLLNENGRIAMVIPAELFQVNYAAELRLFLSEHYSRITLVTFKRLVFDGVQQEIVLLLGERNGAERTGIRTVELEDADDLASYQHTQFSISELKPMDHSTEKWTQYFLDTAEIELLRALRPHPELTVAGEVIDVDVGVVTGLNKFFVLTKQQTRDHSLESYTGRLVGRSGSLRGIVFTEDDWSMIVERNEPAFLLDAPSVGRDELPDALKKYVSSGEAQDFHTGYKCRIRKLWYRVPSVSVPDAFMLRQIHGYPKLVLNHADATCTDTIHRVRIRNGADGENVVAGFLNSLTFAFSEVFGRSYGGGVLELEPNEAERIPLPLAGAEQLDLVHLNQVLLVEGIDAVLDITDQVLLKDGLGLNNAETVGLRTIWQKLRDRRINRKPKKRS